MDINKKNPIAGFFLLFFYNRVAFLEKIYYNISVNNW